MTHAEGAKVTRAAIVLVTLSMLLATMACMPLLSQASIDLAALPKGSTLINRPMAFYSVHRQVPDRRRQYLRLGILAEPGETVSLQLAFLSADYRP